jgi:hypothetical protein
MKAHCTWRLVAASVALSLPLVPLNAQAHTVGAWSGKPQLPGVGAPFTDYGTSAWNCYNADFGGTKMVPPGSNETCAASYWEIPLPIDNPAGGPCYNPLISVYNAYAGDVQCDWDVIEPNGNNYWDSGWSSVPYSGNTSFYAADSTFCLPTLSSECGDCENYMFITCSLPQYGDVVWSVDY